MILKSFELNKIKLNNYKFYLFYGDNEGLKEETIKMVNVSAAKMPEEASGIDLSNMIFKLLSQIEKNPVDLAKEYLKQELRKII